MNLCLYKCYFIVASIIVISTIVHGIAPTFVINVYSDGSIDATGVISGKYSGMYNSGNGTVRLMIYRNSFVFNASATEIVTGGPVSDLSIILRFLRIVQNNYTCIDKIGGSTKILLVNNSMIFANYTFILTTDIRMLTSSLNGTILFTGTGERVTTIEYIANMTKDSVTELLRSFRTEGVDISAYRPAWINNTTVKILFMAKLNLTSLFDIPRNASALISRMNIPWRGKITYSLHWYNETGLANYNIDIIFHENVNAFIKNLHKFIKATITKKTIIIYNNIPPILTHNIYILGYIGKNLEVLPSNSTIKYNMRNGYLTIWFKTPRFKAIRQEDPQIPIKAFYNIVMALIKEQENGATTTYNPEVKIITRDNYVPVINNTIANKTIIIPFNELPNIKFIKTSSYTTTTNIANNQSSSKTPTLLSRTTG